MSHSEDANTFNPGVHTAEPEKPKEAHIVKAPEIRATEIFTAITYKPDQLLKRFDPNKGTELINGLKAAHEIYRGSRNDRPELSDFLKLRQPQQIAIIRYVSRTLFDLKRNLTKAIGEDGAEKSTAIIAAQENLTLFTTYLNQLPILDSTVPNPDGSGKTMTFLMYLERTNKISYDKTKNLSHEAVPNSAAGSDDEKISLISALLNTTRIPATDAGILVDILGAVKDKPSEPISSPENLDKIELNLKNLRTAKRILEQDHTADEFERDFVEKAEIIFSKITKASRSQPTPFSYGLTPEEIGFIPEVIFTLTALKAARISNHVNRVKLCVDQHLKLVAKPISEIEAKVKAREAAHPKLFGQGTSETLFAQTPDGSSVEPKVYLYKQLPSVPMFKGILLLIGFGDRGAVVNKLEQDYLGDFALLNTVVTAHNKLVDSQMLSGEQRIQIIPLDNSTRGSVSDNIDKSIDTAPKKLMATIVYPALGIGGGLAGAAGGAIAGGLAFNAPGAVIGGLLGGGSGTFAGFIGAAAFGKALEAITTEKGEGSISKVVWLISKTGLVLTSIGLGIFGGTGISSSLGLTGWSAAIPPTLLAVGGLIGGITLAGPIEIKSNNIIGKAVATLVGVAAVAVGFLGLNLTPAKKQTKKAEAAANIIARSGAGAAPIQSERGKQILERAAKNPLIAAPAPTPEVQVQSERAKQILERAGKNQPANTPAPPATPAPETKKGASNNLNKDQSRFMAEVKLMEPPKAKELIERRELKDRAKPSNSHTDLAIKTNKPQQIA